MSEKNIKALVMEQIANSAYVSAEISEGANLYTDYGFDSLSFVSLLVVLEEMLGISFGIDEMEDCTNVGRLVSLAEAKVKEAGGVD